MEIDLKVLHLETRGIISLAGKDSKNLLQGLITNDMDELTSRGPIYTALLTPQGKYLFDFFIIEDGEALLLDCEAERTDALIQRLTFYKLRAEVDIKDVSDIFSVLAFPPTPKADSSKWAENYLYLDPRHNGMGYRAILQKPPKGTKPWDYTDYEDLRLSLGIPDGARDIEVDKRFILEANLAELNGVDFDKGCYVGQEMTARMNYRGTLKKRLLPATIEGSLPAPGTKFFMNGKPAGHILSGYGKKVMTLTRLEKMTGKPFETKDGAKVSVFVPEWLKL